MKHQQPSPPGADELPSSPQEILQNNDFFDTDYLKADLKGRSVRGGAATMFGEGAKFVLHTGSTVALARLLTPQDYGLIAMVLAVTNFVRIFRDVGLSMATVQRAEISHAQISTLLWINTAVGVGLAALTAALAPMVAWFYGESRLTTVTMMLSIMFIFSGLTVQHQALLKRHMRFMALATIEVGAMAVGVGAAIVAAVCGAQYWSLVFMNVAVAAAMAVGVWIAARWRPGWPRLRSGICSMLVFGGNVTGFHLVNYFARNADNILLGRFWGPQVLGLYSRAYSLLMLPLSQMTWPLTSVAMPALSRLQDDPERYASYYTKLVQLLSFVSMPLIVFLAVCSKNVIHLLLGEQWLGTSGIFQILAITAFIQPVWSTMGVVLLSLGQSGRTLRFGIFHSSVVVASFAIGIRWGAIGVASAYTVAEYLILFPSVWYCFRRTPITVAALIRTIARPTIASLVMALAILLAHPLLVNQRDIVIIGACFVIGFSAYFLAWAVMPAGMQTLRDFVRYVSLIFRRQERI
jgi:PST family polysaccharide transporter